MKEKISRNICAFANDLPGHGKPGVLFVGVEDDGSCTGLNIDDSLLNKLAELRDGGLLQPLPSMDVQRKMLNGCDVAVVLVHPAHQAPGPLQRSGVGAGRAHAAHGIPRGRTAARGTPPGSGCSVRSATRS